MKDFRNIKFGKMDAATEGVSDPSLLTNGFFDNSNLASCALEQEHFLFLGYKGSGKSALSLHLLLSNQQNPSVRITNKMLSAFPYKLFPKIVKGEIENEAKFPTAWKWILLMFALNSFNQDEGAQIEDTESWNETIRFFKDSGIFPLRELSDIVVKASKKTFTFNIHKFISSTREYEYERNIDMLTVINHIKSLLIDVKTENSHFLIIDGLDEFLSYRDVQQLAIVGLINGAKELNNWFSINGVPFKIIILCRSDVFDRLSDPNLNKIRRDLSKSLIWFTESDSTDYRNSNLIKLANLRCQLIYQDVHDMFKQFFPIKYDGIPIEQYLLDMTRHTPRDFLQLLVCIQQSCDEPNVTAKAIEKGIKLYSLDYFQTEIRDELAGYISSKDIDALFQVLSELRRREFYLSDIISIAEKYPNLKEINWTDVFQVLFECSAIGHLKGSDNKFYIKYRNRMMIFDQTGKIILHKGLWKALVS